MMDAVITLPHYACLRCGHSWLPRIATRPIRCPGCKSPYWHTPRKRGIAQPREIVEKTA